MYLLLPSTVNGHTLPIVFGHTVSAAQDMGNQAVMVQIYLAYVQFPGYLICLLHLYLHFSPVQELHPV